MGLHTDLPLCATEDATTPHFPVGHSVWRRPSQQHPSTLITMRCPETTRLEAKPRHPTHFATWLKQARNEIKMIGSVLGLEHRSGRLKALEQIEQAHEADPEAWPEAYCYSLSKSWRPHGLRSLGKGAGSYASCSTANSRAKRIWGLWRLHLGVDSHSPPPLSLTIPKDITRRSASQDSNVLSSPSFLDNCTTRGRLRARLVRSQATRRVVKRLGTAGSAAPKGPNQTTPEPAPRHTPPVRGWGRRRQRTA